MVRYKLFYISTITLLGLVGIIFFFSQKNSNISSIYKYYEFGPSGYMERKGSVTEKKLIPILKDNMVYKNVVSSNLVMSRVDSNLFISNLMGVMNEFCKKDFCKTYEYLGQEKDNTNNIELYYYTNDLTISVTNKDLLYVTIPADGSRPSQCLYLITDSNGGKSCKGLDESYYNNKYRELIDEMILGHDVTIKYVHDPLLQSFSYIVTFMYGGLPSNIKWYLDFGPEGIFSFVGTNYIVELAENFKNISFEKSFNYYKGNKVGYKLLPEFKIEKINDYDPSASENIVTIRKVGETIRFYSDPDGRLYILPYYELFTNKGVYLLLGSEKI